MHKHIKIAAMVTVFGLFAGCSTAPKTAEKRSALESEAQAVISRMNSEDPSLRPFLNRAYGYAVFPSVGKGAVGVGGAYGRGVVYEQNRLVGYSDVTQASLGFQLGGQAYSQIIAFETAQSLADFKSGNFTFAANASAVAVKAGAAAATNFVNGTAVFTQSEAGLMYEASLGGQRFTYQPADLNP